MTERETDGVMFGRRLRELRLARADALDCRIVDLVEVLDERRNSAVKARAD